jgi:hypothetical protein
MKKQRGRNNRYPDSILIWSPGEDVPEWLSDRARVDSVDLETGNKQLKINALSSGGIEILASDRVSVLVRTTGPDAYVCFGDNMVFSLTKTQLDLLYKDED